MCELNLTGLSWTVFDGVGNEVHDDLLHLARRTVETHLTNAFGKLGIHRRAELGTALHANPELSS